MYILYGLAAAAFYWLLKGASLLAMSGLILGAITLVWLLWVPAWGRLIPSLHKAEIKTTPRILSLMHFERTLHVNSIVLGAWSFLSLFALLFPFMARTFPEWVYQAIMTGWFVITGFFLEWLSRQYRRSAALLDPFKALERIEKEALKAKGTLSDTSLEKWSEVLEEITARSLDRDATALASASTQTLCNITEGYIQKNGSRLSVSAPEESQQASRYILHNILEKYADLYARARRGEHHGICQQILAGCGKISIIAAEKNPILASEPIQRISELGLENMETDKQDLGLKTTRLLMQIGKRIASHRHVDEVSMEQPFLTLIGGLEKIAKESFRKNRDTPIPLLSEPFKEIQTIFKEGSASTNSGALAILQKNDQVLSDFANLELVLRTLPPIPLVEEPNTEGVVESK